LNSHSLIGNFRNGAPKAWDLNFATGKFAEYARHRNCRHINILQGSVNKADSVELQVPKDSKYKKTILMECDCLSKYHEGNILFYNDMFFSHFAYARFRWDI